MTRVRRLRDGRIFSGPRGVALDSGTAIAKAVYYCCRGYLPSVEGERYEWVYDETDDRGYPERSDSYWNRKGKWITRAWVIEWRAKFIRAWLESISDSRKWWRASEVASGICRAAEKMDEPFKWFPTPQNVSRHLHTYRRLYKELFGMREGYLSTPVYKGRIFKFELDKVEENVVDILQKLAADRNWGRGKPVIRTDDGAWFRSMAEAERLTQVPYYQIFHCCEGDIVSCEIPLTGERMKFRYATEVDR